MGRPSDSPTWPVTVSASSSRTCICFRSWSTAARFVAIVVLPTPPFGLNTAKTGRRRRPCRSSMLPAGEDGVAASATSGPGRGSPSPRRASEAHRRSTGRSRISSASSRPAACEAVELVVAGEVQDGQRGRLGRAAPRRRGPTAPAGIAGDVDDGDDASGASARTPRRASRPAPCGMVSKPASSSAVDDVDSLGLGQRDGDGGPGRFAGVRSGAIRRPARGR